ncbi:MAG TPA: precorrin-2 C(20)-methyltransferase, partial [Desulfobacteria bacterium]|nr:precorrin-2 C(20)-methyltransferase [Desulfobacteria bacterium]
EKGKNVAFLTIGDASLYSTYHYILRKLKGIIPEVEVETVPGITSFAASAALINEPLASGDEPLVVLPNVTESLGQHLREFPNVVLMKVSRDMDRIITELKASDKQGVFVSRCSSPQQQVVRNLDTLQGVKVDYLSLILAREKVDTEGEG